MDLVPDLFTVANQLLKQKQKAMWGSGDFPVMVDTVILPLSPRVVRSVRIGPGMPMRLSDTVPTRNSAD